MKYENQALMFLEGKKIERKLFNGNFASGEVQIGFVGQERLNFSCSSMSMAGPQGCGTLFLTPAIVYYSLCMISLHTKSSSSTRYSPLPIPPLTHRKRSF
jgi:hypothetical protein